MISDGLPGADDVVPPDPLPLTRWQKFRLVVKVVELRLRFIALMAITGLAFAYWDTLWNRYDKWMRPPSHDDGYATAAGVEFYCPMHPSVIRDESSHCPVCGLPLAKRKKETEVLSERVSTRIQRAPFRIRQAGIRTDEVVYAPLTDTLTSVGTVEYDERRLFRICSKIPGMSRVERLLVNFTGVHVKQGEILAELYSPELYQAIQELLLAQRSTQEATRLPSELGRTLLGDPQELTRLAVEKLGLWGLTRAQIVAILRQGKADVAMPIVSPISGTAIQKVVVEGQYIAEGQAMFEVADLSTVWIKAQIAEEQIGLVREGQAVEASVEAFPGQKFMGTLAFIQPRLDPATRTVEVRYNLDNPDYRLRPGMFATVTLKTPVDETPMFCDRVTFPHPADPRARRAGLTVEEQRTCPVTNAKLGSMGEPVAVEANGQKVWTCCEGCRPKVQADPARYLARLATSPQDAVLTVSESAVIDTGERKLVYVEVEPGVYEGRRVVLGPRSGDRFPVFEGLASGEKVVAHGAFLVDAESRLDPAIRDMPSGNQIPPAAAPTREMPTRSASSASGTVRR
jgi:Cu(I)/Ag(I) efflux system membrane fusion protein